MPKITISSPHKDFENIKHLDSRNVEYWEARELMILLDYQKWQAFQKVITKAIISCKKAGQSPQNHFIQSNKMIKIATGSSKETNRLIENYKLSRYACYLIAQNGDSHKKQIAQAQTYFAIQARRQELFQNMDNEQKRLFIRNEVKNENKKLFSTAQEVGVTNFGKFNNLGYLGLYGLSIPKIKSKKNIGKDDILDRAGASELAANLFRITQTEEKIKKENIKGQGKASLAHFVVGAKVRKSIKDIGGTMPEDLPSEEHIKKIQPGQDKLLK